MQQPGTVNINETIEAWAEICIKIWREKIMSFAPHMWDTGTLFQSLQEDLLKNAGGDIDKIEFTFSIYGVFMDMGVGREFSKGNAGNVDSERKPYPWFSSRFFREVMKLRDLLTKMYGRSIAYNVANQLNESFDQRYSSVINANTVGSLRTVKYREAQSNRNAKNYAIRRSKPGRWTNEWKTWTPNKK